MSLLTLPSSRSRPLENWASSCCGNFSEGTLDETLPDDTGTDQTPPKFMIRALRDPDTANLDRIQVIKGLAGCGRRDP